MFDFTNRVKKIINDYAPKEAKRLGHEYLASEHILLGLLKAEDSVALKILSNLSVDKNDLKKEVEKRCEVDSVTLLVDPGNKEKIQRILEYSRDEARKLRHSYVGTEHLLLALLRDANSIASASLGAFSINYSLVRNELNLALGLQGNPVDFRNPQQPKKESSRTPMLDEFARNLSKMAKEKAVDPVIGREKEIDRVVQILSRKNKNNPVLIGEAGVGKTAVVEGLAQRIVEKKIPEFLFSKIIFSLDVAALIAGTKYRGEFEDRIKKIMKEIKANPDVVLFIDELHTIIGAGAAEGAVDAANILKPALARGEIQCIGATTLKEYKKYIEKDSALDRRFQSVLVNEPTPEDAIRILIGLRKSYEKHHQVEYTREAIKAAVRLSHRYINDRFLPDKAIDIMDEAGAHVRLRGNLIPPELKTLEKKIAQVTSEKNNMVRLQKYEKAANLRDKIVTLEKEMEEKLVLWRKQQKEKHVTIQEKDVNEIVSEWTGIPIQQLASDEKQKLKNMEQDLQKDVIGQNAPIELLSRAVKRARAGIKPANRPIGSFIFLGPTGVGKTEMAKALARFMFGNEDALLRYDMSEFMEMHSVSKFIGSPPGYVGFEDGGQLTEAVRRKPYSILLFDEIEKAHPEIQNILLQILDEGKLTDASGNKISFKETIIIMTSNIGARFLVKGGRVGFSADEGKFEAKKEMVQEELHQHFSPEFINRLDEIIVFEPLDQKGIRKVVDKLIEEIQRNIIHQKLHIVISPSARNYLGEKGYSEKYGARPLRRLLRKEIEDEIAARLLDEKIVPQSEIKISLKQTKTQTKTQVKTGGLSFSSSAMDEETLKKLMKKYDVHEDSMDNFWLDDETVEEENDLDKNDISEGKSEEQKPVST